MSDTGENIDIRHELIEKARAMNGMLSAYGHDDWKVVIRDKDLFIVTSKNGTSYEDDELSQ